MKMELRRLLVLYIDKRIKDKCYVKADEWTDNVLERLAISQSE